MPRENKNVQYAMEGWRGKGGKDRGAEFQDLTYEALGADAVTAATKERRRAVPKLKSDLDRTFTAASLLSPSPRLPTGCLTRTLEKTLPVEQHFPRGGAQPARHTWGSG